MHHHFALYTVNDMLLFPGEIVMVLHVEQYRRALLNAQVGLDLNNDGIVEVLEIPNGMMARVICETCRRDRGQS